jgi:hypothetical protein
VEAQIVAAMQAVGIEPAKIHAFRRTGLIPTTENASHLSAQDREDWQLALEEYRALEERRNQAIARIAAAARLVVLDEPAEHQPLPRRVHGGM